MEGNREAEEHRRLTSPNVNEDLSLYLSLSMFFLGLSLWKIRRESASINQRYSNKSSAIKVTQRETRRQSLQREVAQAQKMNI